MADINFSEEKEITINILDEEPIQVEVPDINYIPGYKIAEEQRRANELERIANEEERQDYYEEIQTKVNNGEFDGKSLEYDWNGTELGVRQEGETEYSYTDLRGEQGIQGVKGEAGDSGVYVGSEEPTEDDVNVWINPEGTASPEVGNVTVIYIWDDDETIIQKILKAWRNGNALIYQNLASKPRRVYYWAKTFTNDDGSMNFVFENQSPDCIYEIVFKLSGEGFNTLTKTENKYELGSSVDGKKIHYEDDCGYGTPDNVQDALNFAFEELENKATYEDFDSKVSFNQVQNKTNTEKSRARNNIGIPQSCIMYTQFQDIGEGNKQMARHNLGVRGFTDLGEIDLADYYDDVGAFIDTLTEEGTYKFVDNVDYFTWVVEVWWLGDYNLGQKYFYEEEGFTCQYYRNGYYNEDDDTYSWDEWSSFFTYEQATNAFANRSHSHYTTLTTPYDIRGYLDRVTNYNIKELRITSSTNKHLYIAKVDYVNYTIDGTTRYVRYQEYFDIEEPNKIYKRTGLDVKSSTSNITWGDWYVFNGEKEV